MNALLRILAWLLAVALVALPVVAVLNGWVGAGHWPLSRLRANGYTLSLHDVLQIGRASCRERCNKAKS